MLDEAVWDKPNPNKGEGNKMTSSQRAEAKRRAKAAGRPYPNLVDNMAAMKEDWQSVNKKDYYKILLKLSFPLHFLLCISLKIIKNCQSLH